MDEEDGQAEEEDDDDEEDEKEIEPEPFSDDTRADLIRSFVAVARKAKEDGAEPVDALREHKPLVEALENPRFAAESLSLAMRALRLVDLPQDAMVFFKGQTGRRMTLELYTEVMYASEQMESWNVVLRTLDAMKSRNIKPDLNCYNCALRALVQVKGWKRSQAVMSEMRDEGVFPDATSYSLTMQAIPSKAKSEMTHDLFNQMIGTGCLPNQECYAHTVRALSCGSQWQASLRLFDSMRKSGFEVESDTIWFALRACVQAPNPDLATDKMREIEADPKLTVAAVHYDVVISACERQANWPEVLAVAGRMGARGVNPNELTSNSVLVACVELGKVEIALNLFRTMTVDGALLDIVAYFTMIKALHRERQPTAVLEVWDSLLKSGYGQPADASSPVLPKIILEPEVLFPVITAHVVEGSTEEALDLFNQASDRDLVRVWRQRRFGGGRILLDTRDLTSEVAYIAVLSVLRRSTKIAQRAKDEDLIIVVEAQDLKPWSPGEQVQTAAADSPAGVVLDVLRKHLGPEVALEATSQPYTCIRVPAGVMKVVQMQS